MLGIRFWSDSDSYRDQIYAEQGVMKEHLACQPLADGQVFFLGEVSRGYSRQGKPYSHEAHVGSKRMREASAEGPNINRW